MDHSNARGGHRLIPGAVSGAPVLDDVFDTRGGLTDPEQDVEAYGFALNARGRYLRRAYPAFHHRLPRG